MVGGGRREEVGASEAQLGKVEGVGGILNVRFFWEGVVSCRGQLGP